MRFRREHLTGINTFLIHMWILDNTDDVEAADAIDRRKEEDSMREAVRDVHSSISCNLVNNVSHSINIMPCTKLRPTSKFASRI